MAAQRPLPRRSSVPPWLVPLALATTGAVGWACRDAGFDATAGSDDVGRDPDGDDGDPSVDDGPDDSADDDTVGDTTVSRRDVLRSIATQVIAPATVEFQTLATALQGSVQSYADATAAAGPIDEPLAAARTAWIAAMTQWQRLEVMQIGPAASSAFVDGGMDLRDAIYSWPTVDTCSVDRALVMEDYAAADFFVTELVWAYGLDALEYLLFGQGDAHTCPAQVQLDAPWTALGPEERLRRRGAYAKVLADGIAAKAGELAQQWAADGGDYGSLLAVPGEGASPYTDDADAIDDVFRAMFYVELTAKDDKIGVPIGSIAGCPALPCIDLMEAPHSGIAAVALRSNLEALRLVLHGGPDPQAADGFDDLLAQLGEDEIAADLDAAIGNAIAATEAFDGSLQSELAADPAALDGLFAGFKGVTDVLKGPLRMALMLSIPTEGAGDND